MFDDILHLQQVLELHKFISTYKHIFLLKYQSFLPYSIIVLPLYSFKLYPQISHHIYHKYIHKSTMPALPTSYISTSFSRYIVPVDPLFSNAKMLNPPLPSQRCLLSNTPLDFQLHTSQPSTRIRYNLIPKHIFITPYAVAFFRFTRPNFILLFAIRIHQIIYPTR